MLQGPAPELRKLELQPLGHYRDDQPEDDEISEREDSLRRSRPSLQILVFRDQVLPKLRSLTVNIYLMDWEATWIANLTELELRTNVSLGQLAPVLARCPSLEILYLQHSVQCHELFQEEVRPTTLPIPTLKRLYLEGFLRDISPMLKFLQNIHAHKFSLLISEVLFDILADERLLGVLQVVEMSAPAFPFDTVKFRAAYQSFWLCFMQMGDVWNPRGDHNVEWEISPWTEFTPEDADAPSLAAYILQRMPRGSIRNLIIETELSYPQHEWLTVSWPALTRLQVFGVASLEYLLENANSMRGHAVLMPQLTHLSVVNCDLVPDLLDKLGQWVVDRSSQGYPLRMVDVSKCAAPHSSLENDAQKFWEKHGLTGSWQPRTAEDDQVKSALEPW
jgi:hypothetical protein